MDNFNHLFAPPEGGAVDFLKSTESSNLSCDVTLNASIGCLQAHVFTEAGKNKSVHCMCDSSLAEDVWQKKPKFPLKLSTENSPAETS